jgi:hypothetical protein
MSDHLSIQREHGKEVNIDIIFLDDERRKVGHNLTILQWIEYKLFRSVRVGFERQRGWRGELPVYLFKCDRHGLQTAYPSGHGMVLLCPECLRALRLSKS